MSLLAIGTIGAAVAALGSLLAAYFTWRGQRDATLPNVSAGYLLDQTTGLQTLRFVNAGPGLAIALSYYGVTGSVKYGGFVGQGHLLAGESKPMDVPPTPGKTADFVWLCRDIHGTTHVWSYDERKKKKSRRWAEKHKMRNLGGWFELMYPGIPIPNDAREGRQTSNRRRLGHAAYRSTEASRLCRCEQVARLTE